MSCPRCLKGPQKWDDIIYSQFLPTVRVVGWNKLLWYWNSQFINNKYLLKDNWVTITYIKYIRKLCCVFVFRERHIEEFGWYCFPMLISFVIFYCEVFAGEASVTEEISFLILLSSVWSPNFLFFWIIKEVFSERIFMGANISDWLTDDFVSFYHFMIDQPIKSSDQRLRKEYPFYESDFNWSSN